MSEPEAAITAAQLDAIFPGRGDWAVWLDAAMQRYAITTAWRIFWRRWGMKAGA